MPKIQDYPTVDSVPIDPFEGLVEVYFQIKGYITSSNKWFWVRDTEKKQRGYQDIDVLALNGTETVIVSVTTNLDDKVRLGRNGELREDMLGDLSQHFDRVTDYLKSVRDYAWLANSQRSVRKVVAFAFGKASDKLRERLKDCQIELLSGKEMLGDLRSHILKHSENGLNTKNQLVKTIQLLERVTPKTLE